MNMTAIHAEIAKELFLDLMTNSQADPEIAAQAAIEQADTFVFVYQQRAMEPDAPKLKGCPTCFGSGGKRSAPCKQCNGTGKVLA
jgi:DnaJ-class molecular chaperone